MVFIICYGNLTGSGTINVNGATAGNTTPGHNDAPGGGGGGGTIILAASGTISNSFTLTANGGNGGNQLITNNESEGPGGGGGGGYIAISSGSPTRTANAGSNGTTSSASLTEFLPNGATSGGAGTNNAAITVPNIIGTIIAHAGDDDSICSSTTLGATPAGDNAIGTWSIISGVGGTVFAPNNPLSAFTGDSSETYVLRWIVVNNLCQSDTDEVTLFPNCAPLPVSLFNFKATHFGEIVLVEWTTLSETNNDYFTIERSIDGTNWEFVGMVVGAGNSNNMLRYSFEDYSPIMGKTFYRLKQTDYDGTYSYSEVSAVQWFSNLSDISVFPVPSSKIVYIKGIREKNHKIVITDISGVALHLPISQNADVLQLDICLLQKGVYFVHITRQDNSVGIYKFIKE